MHPSGIAFAFAAVLSLAACGGGGGTPADHVRALTGSLPPAENAAAQGARADGIVDRADSLVISSTYGNATPPGLPPFTLGSTCEATTCTIHDPRTGASWRIGPEDFQPVSSTREGIRLTKSGITLGEAYTDDFETYGAWMRHAVFAVQSQRTALRVQGRSYDLRTRYGIAGGDLTGTRPTAVSATWSGVMVGTPVAGAATGNTLQGDATLTWTLEGGHGALDAAFTDIEDLDRLAAHPAGTVRFAGVPVRGDGTFGTGSTGNRIQGGFYGPDHAETAGVFEHSDIVGAFGAGRR